MLHSSSSFAMPAGWLAGRGEPSLSPISKERFRYIRALGTVGTMTADMALLSAVEGETITLIVLAEAKER